MFIFLIHKCVDQLPDIQHGCNLQDRDNLRVIFGSDWNQKILDGRKRKVLVDSKIVYPYGITLDYPNKQVYWVDTYLDYIGMKTISIFAIFLFKMHLRFAISDNI